MTRIQLFTLTIIASAAMFALGLAITYGLLTDEQGGAVGATVIGLLASLEV